jgi:hypothetical protein
VGTVLVVLGFICFILPGIYLMVAWDFSLALVIDKGLDFWSAMEVSRKVISRHWWKFFGFVLILLLLKLAGFLFLLVGVFIAAPIARASLMYTYDDLFGAAGRTPNPAPAVAGPSGTVVRPAVAARAPGPGGSRAWKWVLGFAALLLAIAAIIIFVAVVTHVGGERRGQETAARQAEGGSNVLDTAVSGEADRISPETLRDRMKAASEIRESPAKDKSLASVAADAAKAGEVDLVKDALQQIRENSTRSQTALLSARLLAKRGLRKQAIEVAKCIGENSIRDQALSELAQ